MRLFALAGLALAGAAPLPATRVFIASDSTAQDYAADRYPQSGWGTMLRCAFGREVTVENRAMGGRSTKTFIGEGRLDGIARDIGPGDTLLIQFGHNDANEARPERFTSVGDYGANLRRFVAAAREHGAQPVLLTPVTRRSFDGAHVRPSFPAYSDATRTIAAETRTPLIDLDRLSARWVERAGPDRSRALYLHYAGAAGLPGFPNGIDDDTHFSEAGARGVAEIVARSLRSLPVPLARHVLATLPALAGGKRFGDARCA